MVWATTEIDTYDTTFPPTTLFRAGRAARRGGADPWHGPHGRGRRRRRDRRARGDRLRDARPHQRPHLDPHPGLPRAVLRRHSVRARLRAAVRGDAGAVLGLPVDRSEEHTAELQLLMLSPYAVLWLKKKQHSKKVTE